MDGPTIVVGLITKARGLKGEVAVRNRSDNPDRWIPGAAVFTRDGRELTVSRVRPHGDRLLVTFDQVGDRGAAEALRGAELVIPLAWLPVLGPDEWWPHDLEGCAVETEEGRRLGVVREVIFNPANDLWVTVDETGVEVLIPASRDLLVGVDVAAKRIVVRDVPGLTTPHGDLT